MIETPEQRELGFLFLSVDALNRPGEGKRISRIYVDGDPIVLRAEVVARDACRTSVMGKNASAEDDELGQVVVERAQSIVHP